MRRVWSQVLAKDNDIMWGGGRPDDITVVVTTVVDLAEEEPPSGFAAFTGPGPPPDLEEEGVAAGT